MEGNAHKLCVYIYIRIYIYSIDQVDVCVCVWKVVGCFVYLKMYACPE